MEITRLQSEEQERQRDRKQKEHEAEVDQLKEEAQGWSTRI